MRSFKLQYLIVLLLCAISISSCLNLDDAMFNNWKVDRYEYDAYEGGEFQLDDKYTIDSSKVTAMTIPLYDQSGKIYEIHAVYLGDLDQIDQDTVILYCHGNTGHIDYYFQRAKLLYQMSNRGKYGVLLFDYRGYGKSEGNPSEANMIFDTRYIVNHLKTLGVTGDQLIMYGYSLGSIPSVNATVDKTYPLIPRKLILEAPIGSIDAFMEGGSGLSLPGSFVTQHKTNNIQEIKKTKQALYLMHGNIDNFIDHAKHGLPIYKNHQGAFKVLHVVKDGNHTDLPKVIGFDRYIDNVLQFIQRQ